MTAPIRLERNGDVAEIVIVAPPVNAFGREMFDAGDTELALCCDMLWAAEGAQFGLVEATIGITPLMGGTQRVTERAGTARARELVMGAGLYDAQRMLEWGVVNRVLPAGELLAKGRHFAARLAGGPTVAHGVTTGPSNFHRSLIRGQGSREDDGREAPNPDERTDMPVAFIMDFPGATLEQYDEVMQRMGLDGELPDGAIFHAAAANGDDLRVVDVWETDEAFQAFAESNIGPHSAAVGVEQPAVQRVPVHNLRDERDGGDAIAFLQIVRMPGIDADGFDENDAKIVSDNQSPDGLVFHIAGPTEDGFLVADVWTSKDARDVFRDNKIAPVMADAELSGPPTFDDHDVHAALGATVTTNA